MMSLLGTLSVGLPRHPWAQFVFFFVGLLIWLRLKAAVSITNPKRQRGRRVTPSLALRVSMKRLSSARGQYIRFLRMRGRVAGRRNRP